MQISYILNKTKRERERYTECEHHDDEDALQIFTVSNKSQNKNASTVMTIEIRVTRAFQLLVHGNSVGSSHEFQNGTHCTAKIKI